MRTKHFLMAMALPAVFAACSQDEFVTDNGSDKALEGRKNLGKIALTIGGDAETRWGIAGDIFNAIRPENLDGFAAMLVDAPKSYKSGNDLNDQHIYAIDNYDITPYISTNYKYEWNATSQKWTSQADLVEGNYVFIAPFDNSRSTRQPAEAVLPSHQKLAYGTDGKTIDKLSAIKKVVADGKTPFYVAHRFIEANSGTSHELNFYHLYAYPLIKVINENDNEKDVVVKKVIIKQGAGAFTLNAPFNNSAIAEKLINEVFEKKGTDKKDQALFGTWPQSWRRNIGVEGTTYNNEDKGKDLETAVKNAIDINNAAASKGYWNNGLTGKTSELLSKEPTSVGQYIVIDMPTEEGVTLKYGEKLEFNAVIPAENYTLAGVNNEEGLEIYVVVGDAGGGARKAYKTVARSTADQMEIFPGKQYPMEDYSGNSLKPAASVGEYFTVLTNTAKSNNVYTYAYVDAPVADVVDSEAKLIEAIKNAKSGEELNVTVYGKNVKYTKDVNEAVANNNCQKVNIIGDITIDAENKTLEISDKVSFNDIVVTNGVVVVKKGNEMGRVFVDKDAMLSFTSGSASKIYNAGTLKLGVEAEVENYAELQVAEGAEEATIENKYAACTDASEKLSPSIELKPSVKVLAGGSYTPNKQDAAGNYIIDYEITVNAESAPNKGNEGKLILKNTTMLATATYANGKEVKGTIVNEGKITDNTADGNELLIIPAGYEMTNGSSSNTKAKIDVNIRTDKEILGTTVYTPAGKLNNYGQIGDADAELDLYIGGLLIMKDSEARVEGTWQKGDAWKGEIDNTAKGTLVLGEVRGAVFATKSSLGDIDENELADLNQYGEDKSNCVSEFRLTGAWTVSKDITVAANAMNVKTIKFIAGSSMKFTADAKVDLGNVAIEICGKDIEWTGRTQTATTVSATVNKGTYVGKNGEGIYVNTLKGNLKHANVGITGSGDIDE